MEIKIKNRELDTILSLETKLNINVEHTITEFYKDVKNGNHDYDFDMNSVNKKDMYLIKLVEEDETLEEIYVSDMDEVIQAENRDNKELELGNEVLNEVLEGDE